MRCKTNLTMYDKKPEGMKNYLRYNGPHFSKNLYEMAVKRMYKEDPETGKKERMKPLKKEDIDKMLEDNDITLNYNELWDYMYVASMGIADYYGEGKAIEDEEHLARYIKDTVDDVDAADGEIFECFIAKCARRGVVIDWDEAL